MLNIPNCMDKCNTCARQGDNCLAGRGDDDYVEINFMTARRKVENGVIEPNKDLLILYPKLRNYIPINLMNMDILFTFNTDEFIDSKELDRRIKHQRLKYTLKSLTQSQDLLKKFVDLSKQKYIPLTGESYDLIMSTISSHALIVTNINQLNDVLKNVEIAKANKLESIPIYILIIKNIKTNTHGKVTADIDLLKIDKHQATYRQRNMINMYINLNKQVEELNEIRNKKL